MEFGVQVKDTKIQNIIEGRRAPAAFTVNLDIPLDQGTAYNRNP